MSDCCFCKHSYKFKFPYSTWAEIAKTLYDRAVSKFTPVETITFIFKGKPWIIADHCGYHGDGVATEVGGELDLQFVEPLRREQVPKVHKNYTVSDYRWPKVNKLPPNRDMLLLKKITKANIKLGMCLDVYDIFGDGLHHHCGVRKVEGCKDAKIYLEEAWTHED